MSLGEELKQLDREIRELETEAREVQQAYTAYAAQVQSAVRSLLTEAGVWDETHAMELERAEAQRKAQEKLAKVQEEIRDRQQIRKYLTERSIKRRAAESTASMEAESVKPEAKAEPTKLEATAKAPAPGGPEATAAVAPTKANGQADDGAPQASEAPAPARLRPVPPTF